MYANTIAYLHMVFYDRVGSNTHVIANLIQLSDHDGMSCLKISAYAIPGIDHRV
jgi:hypothetical protein